MDEEEAAIIRESLFSLLGVSGNRIKFYEELQYESLGPQIKVRVQRLPDGPISSNRRYSRLGSGSRELLYQCGEAGCIYQVLSRFIQEKKNLHGAIMDGFCEILDLKLQDYEHSIVPLHQLDTLREVLVAIRRPVERLQFLRRLVDTGLSGPRLLRHLLLQNETAGPSDSVVILEVLNRSSQPWFQLLYDWTFDGKIADPHHEFFVEDNASAPNLWTERYAMRKILLPTGIIDSKLADLAFYVGKAVNFIRSTLSDGTWSLKELLCGSDRILDSSEMLRELGFYYDHTKNCDILRRTLEKASLMVNERILSSLKRDFRLKQHLYALKQFLLLGQGDFFTAFLEGIQTEYFSTTTDTAYYRHDLMNILETAIEKTNATRMEMEVLNRLQIELLNNENKRHRHIFKRRNDGQHDPLDQLLFNYTVPEPLGMIVDTKHHELYQEIFYFFFEVRRVEFELVHMWRQSSIIQRALNVSTQRLQDRTGAEAAQVFLRQVAYAQQAMMHFVQNLKSYLSFEVLQCEWDKFVEQLDVAVSVHEVVVLHDRYLHSIVRKAFVKQETDHEISGKLSDLLETCKTFCSYQSVVYTEALEAVDRAAEKRREAEIRARQGGWGFGPEKEAPEDETCFGLCNHTLSNEFDHITSVFHKHMNVLLSLLGKKLHGQSAWEANEDSSTDNAAGYLQTSLFQQEENMLEDQNDLNFIRSLAYQLDSNNFYGFGSTF